MAATGPATLSQIAFEMLKRDAKVDMTFVPYPGNAPAVNALLGEHVTSALSDYAVVAAQLKAGKPHALATASNTRIETILDVPTVGESGYGHYAVDVWFGLFAPARTPNEIVTQVADWFSAALQATDLKLKLATQGLFAVGMCGPDFGVLVRKHHDEYGRIIRAANIGRIEFACIG